MNDAACDTCPPPTGERRSWEPPGGPTRAAGGLLGVVAGEADGWPGGGGGTRATVAGALVDLAASYVAADGELPLGVAERHHGVDAPAWLVAVALARADRRRLLAEALELAVVAGTPRHSLPACVTYVELAAALFVGHPAAVAVELATGRPPEPGLGLRRHPPLCGETAVDALHAGIWALLRPGGVPEVMPPVRTRSTPAVGAAVAGLLGLRDGCGSLPPGWHRRSESVGECFELAPGLVRARCLGADGPLTGTGRPPAVAQPTASGRPASGVRSAGPWREAVGESPTLGSAGRLDGVAPAGRAGPAVDRGGGGVGAADGSVAAHAVTEEMEAIEERAPAPVREEADGPGRPPPGDGLGPPRQTHRRLEGAGSR